MLFPNKPSRLFNILLCVTLLSFNTCSQTKIFTAREAGQLFGRMGQASGKLTPRGGTSSGTAVQLATAEDPKWIRLKTTVGKKERDRAAILALAGEFQVSFEFLETDSFTPNRELSPPYKSWATEKIYVLEDKADFISLQHIMVMEYIKNGKTQGPIVMKHWRQDWTWQPKSYHSYIGDFSWKKTRLSSVESKNGWLQEVFHVDDSPRYASLGKWSHSNNFSRWQGAETSRPLPRRETSYGEKYGLLEGQNTLIIQNNAWTHQQKNYKCQLPGLVNCEAEEIGLNRYRRIVGFDFSAAERYWHKTSSYWKEVRKVWKTLFSMHSKLSFFPETNGHLMFEKHFTYAESLPALPEETSAKAWEIILPHLPEQLR